MQDRVAMATAAEFRTERYFGPAVSLTRSYAVRLWQHQGCPFGLWLHVSLSKSGAFGSIIFSSHILVPHSWYFASHPTHPSGYNFPYSDVWWPGRQWRKAHMCSHSLSSPHVSPTTFSSNTHFILSITNRTSQLRDWVRGHLQRISQNYLKFMLMFSYGTTARSGLGIWRGENELARKGGGADQLWWLHRGVSSSKLWFMGMWCTYYLLNFFMRHIYCFYNNKMCFKL